MVIFRFRQYSAIYRFRFHWYPLKLLKLIHLISISLKSIRYITVKAKSFEIGTCLHVYNEILSQKKNMKIRQKRTLYTFITLAKTETYLKWNIYPIPYNSFLASFTVILSKQNPRQRKPLIFPKTVG